MENYEQRQEFSHWFLHGKVEKSVGKTNNEDTVAILPILIGEKTPILRQKSQHVEKVTKEITKLIADLEDTLTHAEGLGLAAPQIGSPLSLCIAHLGHRTIPLINPEITWHSTEKEDMEEGCLSLPGLQVMVTRPTSIIVQYTDAKGKMQERSLSGLDSRVVQHEVDHLHGILIVDYLSQKSIKGHTLTKM